MDNLVLLLIGLVLLGAVLLVFAYVWYFIIQRSPLRLFMMFLRTGLSRDNIVPDPEAPIQIPNESHFSDVIKAGAAMVKEQDIVPGGFSAQAADPLANPVPREIPKAPLPPEDVIPRGETTSQSGWPIPLDKQTSASPRPFLHISYDTTEKPDDIPDVDETIDSNTP